MTNIKAIIQKEHYATKIFGSNNKIIADESLENGGTAKGFSPHELLASSLASCTVITVRMYADRKQWNLEKIEVNVSIEKGEFATNFQREIEFFGDLTSEQKERLTEIANRCPIHKILSNSININTISL